jgi:hypothetical protein
VPGNVLPIVYPTLGEPIATALAKLIAAIQILQNDVEPLVLGSEMQWLQDFSAGGHALTNLSKLQLDTLANLVGLSTGTLFFSSGELFAQTSAGPVQITLNGGINAAAIGGIVGDYGGVNPARVTYTDATDTYTFTGDTSDWSDLEVDAVKLRNTNNWTTLASTASGPQTWTFGTANTANVALVRQSAAGVLDSATTVTANTPMSGSIVFSGSGKIQHGARSRSMIATRREGAGSANWANEERGVINNVVGGSFSLETPQPESWMTITGFTVHIRKVNATSITFTPRRLDSSASGTMVADGPGVATTAIGYVAVTVNLTTPRVYAGDEHYTIDVSTGQVGDLITQVNLNFTSV